MQLQMPKFKKIATLVLALYFFVALLFPAGLILINFNHTHVCCGGEYRENGYINSSLNACCIICKKIYNIKNPISIFAASVASAALVLLGLFILCFTEGILLHIKFPTLISLKIRLNN